MTAARAGTGGTITSGVLFDLDGTLVDTAYLHTVSWWQARALLEAGDGALSR